jgi:hypothetical protein
MINITPLYETVEPSLNILGLTQFTFLEAGFELSKIDKLTWPISFQAGL